MITNNNIDLSKDSAVRQDAINTIRYTLLLDYQIPDYTDDDSFIYHLFENCQHCCYRLFQDDTQHNTIQEHGYHFFGRNATVSELQQNFFRIGLLPAVSNSPSIKYRISAETTLHLHEMILQHCIMSSYHSIRTELTSGKRLTAYEIYNSQHLKYQHLNKLTSESNKNKSRLASDFERKSKSHLSAMPFLSNLAFQNPFSEFWYSVCETNVAHFKHAFAPNAKTICSNILQLSEALTPKYNIEQKCFRSPSVDSMYQTYLTERIFNFRIFYSTLKAIRWVNKNSPYRLDQEDIIPALASIISLPNVFSRQSFLFYAIMHINRETNSYRDFWYFQDLSKDDSDLVSSARKQSRIFDLYRWKEQFILFTNYLSQYIIPVYEWCFVGMMLDSIERQYSTENHIFHLNKAKIILENYISKNYRTILHPCKPYLSGTEHEKIHDNVISIIPKLDKIYNLDEIPEDIIKHLTEYFFPKEPTFDLNLSSNLKPEYFTHNAIGTYNSPNDRIRKFYIDLLRYNYWQRS